MKIIFFVFFFFSLSSYLFSSQENGIPSLKLTNDSYKKSFLTDRANGAKNFIGVNKAHIADISAKNKENNKLRKELSDLNQKYNDLKKELCCFKNLKSAGKKSSPSQSFNSSVKFSIDNSEITEEQVSLIDFSNFEFSIEERKEMDELYKENEELRDQKDYFERDLSHYKNYVEQQEKEVIELRQLIELYEKGIASRDEQLTEKTKEIESLFEQNESLSKSNIFLEEEKNSLKKQLKEITEKELKEYSMQTDDPKIEKRVFDFKSQVFDCSITPLEKEKDLETYEREEDNGYSKSLLSELGVVDNLFFENALLKERVCSQRPYDLVDSESDFTITNQFSVSIIGEKIEKKMLEESTQTELEEKIEDNLIFSGIKKNKKLFLSLGFILLIATLLYLKKEKVIYWCGFFR